MNNKYEENKKNIESLQKEKEESKNKNIFVNNNNKYNNIFVENKENFQNNNIIQNQQIYKNNLSSQINNNISRNQINNISYQRLLTISEKADNNSEDSEKSLLKLSLISIHRKTKSQDVSSNKFL